MYRIILVDDEPLILAGIASLITWEDYDCTIVGRATNGPSAHDMIMELKPDIVITDIRMPVLSGLELVERCKEEGCTFAFLVLTNLEEFHLVKKALALGASDYLVKIELDEESLVSALERAKRSCDLLIKHQQHQQIGGQRENSEEELFRGYLSRLLLAGGEQRGAEPVPEAMAERYSSPLILLFSLRPDNVLYDNGNPPRTLQTPQQITDILSGIISRFFRAFTLMPCGGQEMYLLAASLKDREDYRQAVTSCCTKINSALKTYFELTAVFGVSTRVETAAALPDALQEARTALQYYYYDSSSPVVFYQGQSYHQSKAKNFNINFLKKDLSASILQNDSEKLGAIFDQIIDLFTECKPPKEYATSTCINIYSYLYSFFEDDRDSYQDIFPYAINIAEQLNQFTCLADILTWLRSFCGKLCRLLSERKETRSDHLVEQAKRYVHEHYTEKLALSDIAEALNISSGHLSNTFKRFTGTTLSDYIAEVKIGHAKELIGTHKYLMYQISEMLGFDNPYYFSKVFKKITGVSPREHENSLTRTAADSKTAEATSPALPDQKSNGPYQKRQGKAPDSPV